MRSRHWWQAVVGQTSSGVFSQTGQNNWLAMAFTWSSEGVGACADTFLVRNNATVNTRNAPLTRRMVLAFIFSLVVFFLAHRPCRHQETENKHQAADP